MTKVLLMILDGWGIGGGAADPADAISAAHPAFIESLAARYPHAELRTYGENVGLPEGQMGNSEVGHLNIGAGRVVYQDLVRINRACAQDKLRCASTAPVRRISSLSSPNAARCLSTSKLPAKRFT